MEKISVWQKIINFFQTPLWQRGPLKKRQLISLLVVLLILIILPASLYLVTHPTIFKPKATNQEAIRLYDIGSGKQINQVNPSSIENGNVVNVQMVIKDTKW